MHVVGHNDDAVEDTVLAVGMLAGLKGNITRSRRQMPAMMRSEGYKAGLVVSLIVGQGAAIFITTMEREYERS